MKIEETTGKSLDPNNMLSLYIHILFNYLLRIYINKENSGLGWVIIPSNAVKYTITRRIYAHMLPKAHS